MLRFRHKQQNEIVFHHFFSHRIYLENFGVERWKKDEMIERKERRKSRVKEHAEGNHIPPFCY